MTLQALFSAIFRLTDVFSDPFDFSSLEPVSPLVSKYAIRRNCFGDLYLCCEGRFIEDDLTPPPTAPTSIPQSLFAPPLRSPYAASFKLKLASLNGGQVLTKLTAHESLESNSPEVRRFSFFAVLSIRHY